MLSLLSRLVCRLRGHVFERRPAAADLTVGMAYRKSCTRCGHETIVFDFSLTTDATTASTGHPSLEEASTARVETTTSHPLMEYGPLSHGDPDA